MSFTNQVLSEDPLCVQYAEERKSTYLPHIEHHSSALKQDFKFKAWRQKVVGWILHGLGTSSTGLHIQ